jgi:hypothetical protein
MDHKMDWRLSNHFLPQALSLALKLLVLSPLRTWERIRILGTGFVETCKVHTEAPVVVSLWDNHWISNPGGVGYLAYQLGLLQLLYLLDDEVLSLLCLLPSLLLHGVCLRAHG